MDPSNDDDELPEATRTRSSRLASSRKRTRTDETAMNLQLLRSGARSAKKIVIFSGSGLSATSGMSTFSTQGGLYDKAKAKFKLASGKLLFTYPFYSRRKREAESFFAEIHKEALQARPARGHEVLAALCASGRLARHYTLNIDGLATVLPGMEGDVWDPDSNPSGHTVEMHGSVHELVCTECGEARRINEDDITRLSEERSVPCTSALCRETTNSGSGEERFMRFKVMMYDDAEGEYITPDDVMDLMEDDIKEADLVIWVGISFEQSASTSYFRNVRRWLQEDDRHRDVPQFVINPSDDALWNVLTASSNQGELNVLEVIGTADDVLPALLPDGDCGR
jgi:NAD-dependent SIR2 family protein deacetylase